MPRDDDALDLHRRGDVARQLEADTGPLSP
jgi:hypothetical protein